MLRGGAGGLTTTGAARYSQDTTGIPGSAEFNDVFGSQVRLAGLQPRRQGGPRRLRPRRERGQRRRLATARHQRRPEHQRHQRLRPHGIRRLLRLRHRRNPPRLKPVRDVCSDDRLYVNCSAAAAGSRLWARGKQTGLGCPSRTGTEGRGIEDRSGALGPVFNTAVLWTIRYLDTAVERLRCLPRTRGSTTSWTGTWPGSPHSSTPGPYRHRAGQPGVRADAGRVTVSGVGAGTHSFFTERSD